MPLNSNFIISYSKLFSSSDVVNSNVDRNVYNETIENRSRISLTTSLHPIISISVHIVRSKVMPRMLQNHGKLMTEQCTYTFIRIGRLLQCQFEIRKRTKQCDIFFSKSENSIYTI